MVCPAIGCPVAERQAAFIDWTNQALNLPGSTFQIWNGENRVLSICVPERWGSNLIEQKTAFRQKTMSFATGGERWEQPGCPEPYGPQQVVIRGTERWSEPEHPLQLMVLCDRSNSTLDIACTRASLTVAFDHWLQAAGPGSSWTVVGVGSRRETTTIAEEVQAEELGLGARVAHLSAGPQATLSFEAGSAIVEALDMGAERIQHQPGHRAFLLLSDMRQFTPSTWNFEKSVPPATRFVDWAKEQDLLPSLNGAQVVACGLHHQQGPGANSFTAKQSAQLTALWGDVFEAAGVVPQFLPDCSTIPSFG